ncbi:hypothetical protein [Pseudanabaena yagii]|uniref:PEP-CTERM sorting domain-containing protein n=1 Tax=Pseudanabaena yagii GIHE-NHR1 TaxID=2722753 RepID=A0ABX1M0S7_9CYAN|nr:hypothetical protein [Pseudanabaena yagii]NMF61236.1 hypothetical protein [Pseudanabaena yagii GIHE-NHR1]
MNKFNRILLASGLAATASLMVNSPAFADTTGKVNLSGTIPSNLSLTVTATSEASAMIFVPGNNTYDLKIANITGAATNSSSGLKVSVLSSWRLTSTSTTEYIVITGFGESTSTSSSIATANRKRIQDNNLQSNVPFDLAITNTNVAGAAPDSSLYISYNAPNITAGIYSGSITFTATDK